MDPKPMADDDAAMSRLATWVYRFGITWCTCAALVYAWRGSVWWVAFYLFWLGVNVVSYRRMIRARDGYLLAKANLEYQRERREGEQ
jgi:hypothetical protein